MSTVRIAIVAGIALATSSAAVSAQSLSPFGMWGEEQRGYRAPPPPAYDDGYEDEQDEYRYQRRANRGRWGDRGFRRDDYFGSYYDDGYGGFDEPPPYDDRRFNDDDEPPAELDGETVAGGPRPEIAAVAPPKVAFYGSYVSGSIVIDVGARKLYYVTGNATAYAYPIGVGRQGFSWAGTEKISRIAEWPDWHPPKEMRERQPGLPAKMTGGINNPLGARALYLGATLYRIHGTNDPKSIGRAESSGCFRMMNGHVAHLAQIAQVGAEVTVVKSLGPNVAASGRAAVR
jgi:lipoprotein-anchoring transpeptidase ErfK/SrfK